MKHVIDYEKTLQSYIVIFSFMTSQGDQLKKCFLGKRSFARFQRFDFFAIHLVIATKLIRFSYKKSVGYTERKRWSKLF